ncbi:AP-5 complex subunit mu [Neltuma alba]|uniref:AP-5 complex subunit mu n=1 Tax=Neltuma alba TaxID=207710 RepID=UPI0010A365E0|nr:AP-5 complex subunit mu [Prosopis alba]
MPAGCSVRAIWILNNLDAVVFSRRFPVVEKHWRSACKSENDKSSGDELSSSATVYTLLPSDSELAAAFLERKQREGSARGFGMRLSQSSPGSDSWVDDPITRHIIGLYINKEQEGDKNLLWPLILHVRGHYVVLVLPLVEPRHLKGYAKLCKRSDCGNALGVDASLSSLLLDLPSITGAFMVAHVIGDIVTGDTIEPEVVVSTAPSVGGLFDSLTGSIGISGISSRAKPVAPPTASSSPASTAASGTVMTDTPKPGSKLFDKDALRTFISSSMPFGTPLDLNYPNIFTIKANGFSASDLPSTDQKQPAWKPYLYKGKQRILFTIHETVNAALYDRDEIPDNISVSGQVNCRAELEGMPDVSLPLAGLNTTKVEVLSYHPCTQVPEQGVDKQAVMFSPPLGNFVLMRYQATSALGPPIKGFYQLSMVSEDKGAFLFKLHLMEGYKAPLTMEFCNVTMPFPRRRIVSLDGTPSAGTVSTSDHSVEWKIVTSGRGLYGKSIEVTFPGTIKFAPWQHLRTSSVSSYSHASSIDEDSDNETENSSNMVNEEHFMEKMNKDLPPADLEEPFCWKAYNYAKVSFRIAGGSLSGITIDPKSVSIYPTVKAPAEFSTQVISGDYILWNTLGKCPYVAVGKMEKM